MRRRCRGALRSWRPRRGRCPLPIGQSCRTSGGPTSVARLPGREGWRVGPARGGTWGQGWSVWCVYACLGCTVMPVRCTAKRSHGGRRMHALVGHPHPGGIPCETWDGGMHTARDLVALSVRPPGQIWAASAPPFSPRCALGRLTWCPHTRLSRACAWPRWARPSAHRRRSEPSDRPDRFDPPFVPAMGNTSGAHFLRRKALATFLGGEFEAVAPRLVVPPAHLVGHAFQGCCPPQLPHTCWRPFGHGVAHARRLKSAHTWSAKRGRTWGGVICCCW